MEYLSIENDEPFERRSNLDMQSIEKILDVFIVISKIEDRTEALKQTDNVIVQISEKIRNSVDKNEDNDDFDAEYFEDRKEDCIRDMERLEKSLEEFEKNFKKDKDFGEWDIEGAYEEISDVAWRWDKEMKEEFSLKLNVTKVNAKKRVGDIEKQYYLTLPEKISNDDIYSISSMKSKNKNLLKCEKYLKKKKLFNNEMKLKVKTAKERLAWYRAQKKINEAEISIGGENFKKARKLKGEAEVLLKQDWKYIFDNTDYPTIDLEIKE